MRKNYIQTIHYNPQDFVEVTLTEPVTSSNHAFYLTNPQLLNCFVHLSDACLIYFDTQNYVSLKHYVTHQSIKKDDLKNWCLTLLELLEDEREGSYIIDLNHIFVDEKTKKWMFCKIPLSSTESYDQDISMLMLEMYEHMNYEGDEEWISQMYLLVRQRPFRLERFKQFLTSKKSKRWLSFFRKEDDDMADFFKLMQVNESEPMYGMSTVPFETQILMAGYQFGYFVDENNQKVLITSSPWIVGRQRDCHYVMDYPEVSKVHCMVIVENGSCFVEDQGSTNGTRINDKKIMPHQRIEIKDLDVVSLAGHTLTYYV